MIHMRYRNSEEAWCGVESGPSEPPLYLAKQGDFNGTQCPECRIAYKANVEWLDREDFGLNF